MNETFIAQRARGEDSTFETEDVIRNSKETISFIIPALNEEKNIGRAISSIKACMKETPYEIIVVDNGSHDSTQRIAASLGAKVIVDETKTIGGLRNLGYKNSKGSILSFIDSDIELDSNWLKELVSAYTYWPENRLIITGSSYLVSEDATFIEKNWFSKFSSSNISYINSGHLVTTREMMDLLAGFDENLKTSEDFDLCQRAKKKGGVIAIEPRLKAYHHGFPATISDFVVREAWHGRADISSVSQFLHSKTAIASMGNSALLTTSVIFLLFFGDFSLSFCMIFVSFLLCSLFTYIKFGTDNLKGFLKTALCFEIYFLGRTLSLFLGKSRPTARAS